MTSEAFERGEADFLMMLDQDTLDPSLNYRFCQQRPSNITRRQLQGYRPVLRSESGVRLLNEFEEKSVDDLIRVGDCILMACPKDRYKKRRKEVTNLGAQRLSAQEKKFEGEARKRGFKPVKGDSKGEPEE